MASKDIAEPGDSSMGQEAKEPSLEALDHTVLLWHCSFKTD